MMENIHDPYDMLINAHARIDYLEIQLNNQMIQNQRNEQHIQDLLNAVQVLQGSQIMILEHHEYIKYKGKINTL